MSVNALEMLRRLGDGATIQEVREAAGFSTAEFDRWWQQVTRERSPRFADEVVAGIKNSVSICRDAKGVPHIHAKSDEDLFFGFGWAMSEDRLFQLDWLRRKGHGRLSEIMGAELLASDLTARTVGLPRIARGEWHSLPSETRQLLEAFAEGINQWISHHGARLPIEFDLLGYRPEPWTPIDSLVIESEFRWYLTGRFPVLCIPELAKRHLGEGALYEQFLRGECDDESILHAGEYPATSTATPEAVPGNVTGVVANDPDGTTGSNNWVLAGTRTLSGSPLVASDPHIAFEAVSCWYEAHLCGGSFHVAGMTYVGMPAIMFGRSERVAWGITNNICSLRDLYEERTDAEHPGCFLYDGKWEPARETEESIAIRGAEPVVVSVRHSRNGPLVNSILPAPADRLGPVSLKWLGAHAGGWLTALQAMNRAGSVPEFREALRPWHVPTFSLVIADVAGNIGFQVAGRIPLRGRGERGFRKGWDPADQWRGLLPFESMPGIENPGRGWVATANNRVAPDDFPFPLSGTWTSGWRARRIRQWIEGKPRLDVADMGAMHRDSVSLRAAAVVPGLLKVLQSPGAVDGSSRSTDGVLAADAVDAPLLDSALRMLAEWDFRSEPDFVAPTIFNVFFTQWCRVVARERFDEETAEFLMKGIEGCAAELLADDPAGWFGPGERETRIRSVFRQTLDDLQSRFGANISDWTWGKLHRIPLRHVLSGRGDLARLLDHGGSPVSGDMVTVGNTGSGPDWMAATGGGYRMVADLGSSPPALLAVDGQSQSGHPGSPHYDDQFRDWLEGRYHELLLTTEPNAAWQRSVLSPREGT